MNVNEVRVAEDKDFDMLKIYLTRNDGWSREYEKAKTTVWTRTPDDFEGSDFKMIRLKTTFSDVTASVLFDVLHDPDYRSSWDRYMAEAQEIGHLNPNNSISYYKVKCPPPLKCRDFVIQSSWLETPKELMIINHSVSHKDFPPRKGTVRGISYLTGFLVSPLTPGSPDKGGCHLGYVTHANPKGNLPTWLSNRASTSFAPKLVRRLYKAALKYPAWKAQQKDKMAQKPWIYPEQIDTPRINVEECQLPANDTGSDNSSSPEDSLVDELEACDLDDNSDTDD